MQTSIATRHLLKGNGFKVILEESFKKEKPEVRAQDHRWYEQIPIYCGGALAFTRSPPQ